MSRNFRKRHIKTYSNLIVFKEIIRQRKEYLTLQAWELNASNLENYDLKKKLSVFFAIKIVQFVDFKAIKA